MVEDVEMNIDLATIRLEQQRHKVTVAWNGREAVEVFESGERFDLILMDIQMPEMGGLEATERIRALETATRERVPIIAMTAAVMREETEEYLAAGMDAVVAKPIDFDKLFKTMEAMIPENVGGVSVMPDNKRKVLVVDDEPTNLKLMSQILQDKYHLSFARDGKIAIDAALKIKPDIILLDVMMPEMDGYEVCRQLKNNPEATNIPVIFLSALTDDEEEEKGLNLGAVDFITKPLESSEIQTKVKQHLLR